MPDERAGKILRWVDLFLNPLGVVVESYEVFLPLANFQLNTFSFRLRPSSFFFGGNYFGCHPLFFGDEVVLANIFFFFLV